MLSPRWTDQGWAAQICLHSFALGGGALLSYALENGARAYFAAHHASPPSSFTSSGGDGVGSEGQHTGADLQLEERLLKMRSSDLVLNSHLDYSSYVRVRELARGGHGAAALWRCTETGHEVVSKQVLPEADPTGEEELCLLALQNEVRLLQNIRHEHVISFIAALQLPGGHFCILQEYARGGTLDAAIHARRRLGKPFESALVARWLRQLALALSHLHGLRVLHRDLSTKNILLSAAPCGGDVRVGDFGVAKALSLTRSSAPSLLKSPWLATGAQQGFRPGLLHALQRSA